MDKQTTATKSPEQQGKELRSKRRTLIIMVMVFALPYGLAWLFFFNPGLIDFGSRSNGTLFSPAVSPSEYEFTLLKSTTGSTNAAATNDDPKWLFASFGDSNCDTECQKTLFTLQQLRRMMAVDRSKINRAYVVLNDAPPENALGVIAEYEGTDLYWASSKTVQLIENKMGIAAGQLGKHIILIDPRGNLVMHYPRDMEPNKMFADIEILFGRVKGI